jgi:hypothetical protein
MGELESAIQSIKECLHNDPDERDCKKLFKKIKNLQKGFSKLDGLGEKRKWRDVDGFLYQDGFLARERTSCWLKYTCLLVLPTMVYVSLFSCWRYFPTLIAIIPT